MRKHMWSKHRTALIGRIKAGKTSSSNNDLLRGAVEALKGGSPPDMTFFTGLTKKQWITVRTAIDTLQPLMPDNMKLAWIIVREVMNVITTK